MISPHAKALYDRLLKKGFDGNSQLPETSAASPKAVHTSKGEPENEQSEDLAPEAKEDKVSQELELDEASSDMPEVTKGLDMGQPDRHPGHAKVEHLAHAGKPKIADIGDILMGSHKGSHPGTMGQKIHASVLSKMKK